MNKWLPFFVLLWLSTQLSAQDEGIYRLYYTNPSLINPAATGFNNAHNINLNGRSSFAGFAGTSRNYSINYNGALSNSLGVGAGIFSETIGELSRLDFQVNFAYRQQLNEITLGAGVNARFQMTTLPNSIYTRFDEQVLDAGDEILAAYVEGRNNTDASFGLFAKHSGGTYAGVSVLNIVQNDLENISEGASRSLFQNYNIFVGHEFEVGEGVVIEPSVLVGDALYSSMFYDATVQAKFLDSKLITGLSYRGGRGGEFGILLGTKLSAFSAYYSYDLYMGDFQQHNSGSHEFTLSFEFGKRN